MRKTNRKLMLSLSVLTTPFVAENIVERNVASANGTYNLTQNVKVYTNAQNAAKQKNSTKTYKSGTYYIYKEYNGMINISRTKGKPGAWINPATNKVVEVPVTKAPVTTTTTKAESAPKKEVKSTSVPTAVTNTKTISEPKKEVETKTTEVATQKPVEVTTTQTPKPLTKGDTYTLNNSVKTYTNAAAAKTQKGAKSTYATGNYFIFKEFNGMLNISRVAGKAGAWINPLENIVKAVVAKTQKTETPAKVNEVKEQPKTTTKTETKSNTSVKPTENTKADNKTEVKEEAKPTSKTEVKSNTSVKVTEETKTDSKTQVKETTTKTSEITESKENITPKKEEIKINFKAGEVFNLSGRTSVYSNAVAAASKTGARTEYNQGQYYIYKVHNGMINISRTKGKAGAWINPAEIGKVVSEIQVLPFANRNYTITSPYGVARNIVSLGRRDIHDGVDFVTTNSKEPILATEAGTVIGAGLSPYGDGAQHVVIKHGENSYTAYWHLARNSVTVKTGEQVAAGQKIGVIGTTGLSTGIHLHFMHATTPNIFRSHTDPMKYLRSLSKK